MECVSTAKKSYKLRIDRKRKYALQTLKSRLLSNALLLLQQKSNLVIGMQFDLSIRVEIIWFRAVTLKFYLNHSRGCKIWQRKLLIKMCHLFLKFSIIISRLLLPDKYTTVHNSEKTFQILYLMQWEQWNILFGNLDIKCKVIIRFRLRQIDQSAHSWHGLKTRMITHDQILFVQSSYVGVKEVGNMQLCNFRIKLLIQLYRLFHLENG